MIVDNHLDDRVIEIIKIMYLDQIKKEMEDDTLLNILLIITETIIVSCLFPEKGNGRFH